MIKSSPFFLNPNQFGKSEPGTTELWRPLIREPEFQLTHHLLPAGHCRVDGVKAHAIVVHRSAGVRYAGRYDGRQYAAWAAPGMSWVRPAEVVHVRSWEEPIEAVSLCLTPKFWKRTLQRSEIETEMDIVPHFAVTDPLVEQIIHALKKGAEIGQPFGQLLRDGLLTALVAHLAHQGSPQAMPATPRGGLAGWRLRRVLGHMEDRLAENVTLAELATLAGLSERHFGQAFRHTVGTPPHRYLLERRILRAKAMFQDDPTLSVIEVALAVGFTASTHFATMFRKVTGGTPTAYRDAL